MTPKKCKIVKGLCRQMIQSIEDMEHYEKINSSPYDDGSLDYFKHAVGTKKSGHARRVSMELTRALSDFRKPM